MEGGSIGWKMDGGLIGWCFDSPWTLKGRVGLGGGTLWMLLASVTSHQPFIGRL